MNENKRLDIFTRIPIGCAVAKLALPSVISQIILVIYNIADTFYIGRTGDDALVTAVTVCMPAFMFLSAISNLFGIGGAAVMAGALGAERQDKAKEASALALWGCFLVTAVYAILAGIFCRPYLRLLGAKDSYVLSQATEYILCTVVCGGLFTSMNSMLAHLIRAEGRAFQASFGVTLGGVLNLLLDPLFMFVLMPNGKEVLGAALATALSNLLALLYYVGVILVNKNRGSILTPRLKKSERINTTLREILSAGLPACMMTLLENISFAVLDSLMAVGGIAMQAGLGVAKKVNMLAHCITRGISQGVLPMLAFNYSAKSFDRMYKTMLLSAGASVMLAALCMMGNFLFGSQILKMFLAQDSASIVWGTKFLKVLSIGCPFSAFAYGVISFFQATGFGKRSFVLAASRKGMIDMPLMILLYFLLGVKSIIWATPVTDVICCIMAAVLYVSFVRKVKMNKSI